MKKEINRRMLLISMLVTLGVITVVDWFKVPNPNVILLTLVVLMTDLGGFTTGGVSAALVIFYSLLFFSTAGELFHYTDINLYKVIIIAVFIPICVVLVGSLKRRERQNNARLEEANRELERLTRIDPLTGIPNRRSFDEMLDLLFQETAEEGGCLCCALVDIDFFKQYNDSYGHIMGDECLQKLAQTMEEEARQAGGFVARIGGEEFGILFPGRELADAVGICRRIADAIRQLHMAHNCSCVASDVTVSIGLAALSVREHPDANRLMSRADQALYMAKQNGRDRIEVLSSGPDNRTEG